MVNRTRSASGRGAIDARLHIGHLRGLHRGVYATGQGPLNLRSRWMAAVLACGDRAVLSHRSAACLWGLTRPRRGPIEVTNPQGSRGPTSIRLHRPRLEEDRFAEFCRKHLADLPAPVTNISILDHEVDAYWPSHRLVIEMDSWEHHSHRAAFEHDRARDAAMQAAGYRVIRLTHRQLESEAPRISTQLHHLLSGDGADTLARSQ